MIEAEGLTKFYGSRAAVSEISFAVEDGETVGFLGPNGAGKSTTMRILTGFLTPSSGSARIAGFDVQQESLAARKSFGYLPESTPLYRDMRVREFLNYRACLKQISASNRRANVDEVLERCRIADVQGRIIGHLSKGYRQRVGVADCLLGKPRLLILDEPTVGLDPNQVQEMRHLIQEIGQERTVFLSTHILHEVERVCQRVLIVHEGRLIAEGATQELCQKYTDHRTISLHLQADEDPEETLRELATVRAVENLGRDSDGTYTYRIVCDSEADPRSAIAQSVGAKGWLLQEMRLEPIQLEDIFAKLTK